MSASKPQRIVIIGGIAGGATAAARLRRLDEKAHIALFERGPVVSYAFILLTILYLVGFLRPIYSHEDGLSRFATCGPSFLPSVQ